MTKSGPPSLSYASWLILLVFLLKSYNCLNGNHTDQHMDWNKQEWWRVGVEEEKTKRTIAIVIPASIVLTILIIGLLSFAYCCWRRKTRQADNTAQINNVNLWPYALDLPMNSDSHNDYNFSTHIPPESMSCKSDSLIYQSIGSSEMEHLDTEPPQNIPSPGSSTPNPPIQQLSSMSKPPIHCNLKNCTSQLCKGRPLPSTSSFHPQPAMDYEHLRASGEIRPYEILWSQDMQPMAAIYPTRNYLTFCRGANVKKVDKKDLQEVVQDMEYQEIVYQIPPPPRSILPEQGECYVHQPYIPYEDLPHHYATAVESKYEGSDTRIRKQSDVTEKEAYMMQSYVTHFVNFILPILSPIAKLALNFSSTPKVSMADEEHQGLPRQRYPNIPAIGSGKIENIKNLGSRHGNDYTMERGRLTREDNNYNIILHENRESCGNNIIMSPNSGIIHCVTCARPLSSNRNSTAEEQRPMLITVTAEVHSDGPEKQGKQASVCKAATEFISQLDAQSDAVGEDQPIVLRTKKQKQTREERLENSRQCSDLLANRHSQAVACDKTGLLLRTKRLVSTINSDVDLVAERKYSYPLPYCYETRHLSSTPVQYRRLSQEGYLEIPINPCPEITNLLPQPSDYTHCSVGPKFEYDVPRPEIYPLRQPALTGYAKGAPSDGNGFLCVMIAEIRCPKDSHRPCSHPRALSRD